MPMYRGVMSKNELEGGFWELSCDDGKRYQVSGGDDGLHQEGIHVEVEGKIDRGAFGIGMTGPTLHVRSYKKI